MADKFTRLGAVEGDIFYATTAGGSKSIESLEDNIDNKLLTQIYTDNTGGNVSGTTSETTIVTYTIPANTVRTGILVMAGITFKGSQGGTGAQTGTFRLKINGTTVKTIALTTDSFAVGADDTIVGTAFFYYDNTQNWTGSVAVLISGENSVNAGGVVSSVDSFQIFGI